MKSQLKNKRGKDFITLQYLNHGHGLQNPKASVLPMSYADFKQHILPFAIVSKFNS